VDSLSWLLTAILSFCRYLWRTAKQITICCNSYVIQNHTALEFCVAGLMRGACRRVQTSAGSRKELNSTRQERCLQQDGPKRIVLPVLFYLSCSSYPVLPAYPVLSKYFGCWTSHVLARTPTLLHIHSYLSQHSTYLLCMRPSVSDGISDKLRISQYTFLLWCTCALTYQHTPLLCCTCTLAIHGIPAADISLPTLCTYHTTADSRASD